MYDCYNRDMHDCYNRDMRSIFGTHICDKRLAPLILCNDSTVLLNGLLLWKCAHRVTRELSFFMMLHVLHTSINHSSLNPRGFHSRTLKTLALNE